MCVCDLNLLGIQIANTEGLDPLLVLGLTTAAPRYVVDGLLCLPISDTVSIIFTKNKKKYRTRASLS